MICNGKKRPIGKQIRSIEQTKLTASAMLGEAVKISVILDWSSGGDRASSSVDCIRETLKTNGVKEKFIFVTLNLVLAQVKCEANSIYVT